MIRRIPSSLRGAEAAASSRHGHDELIARYDADGTSVAPCPGPACARTGLWTRQPRCWSDRATATRLRAYLRSPDKTCSVVPRLLAGGVVRRQGETPDECARRELAEELGVAGRLTPAVVHLSVRTSRRCVITRSATRFAGRGRSHTQAAKSCPASVPDGTHEPGWPTGTGRSCRTAGRHRAVVDQSQTVGQDR